MCTKVDLLRGNGQRKFMGEMVGAGSMEYRQKAVLLKHMTREW